MSSGLFPGGGWVLAGFNARAFALNVNPTTVFNTAGHSFAQRLEQIKKALCFHQLSTIEHSKGNLLPPTHSFSSPSRVESPPFLPHSERISSALSE